MILARNFHHNRRILSLSMHIVEGASRLTLGNLHQLRDDVHIVGLDGVAGGFALAFFAAAQTAMDDLVAFLRIVEDSNRFHQAVA